MTPLELQEFFVEGRDQRESHVLLHITEPSTPEEEKKGYFFALAEINNGTLEHIENLQQLIDDLESGFYATGENKGENKKEDAFEVTLEYMNRRGSKILTGGAGVHILVGVIGDGNLSFAHHGDMHALLLYRQGQESKFMDLLDGSETPEKGRLFSSVMQGPVNAGDFLFVGTPRIIDYFSYDRLHKIIGSRSVKQSTAHIEKVLKDIQGESSFGGIIFRILAKQKHAATAPPSEVAAPLSEAEEEKQNKKTSGSENSLNSLLDARRRTAETLSPPIIKQLIAKAKKGFGNGGRAEQAPKTKKQHGAVETNYRYRTERKPGQSVWNGILIGFGRALVALGAGLYKIARSTGILIGKGIVGVVILITNKNNSRQDVIRAWQQGMQKRRRAFEELPLTSKILLAATIFFAIIFLGSVSFIRIKDNYEAKRQAYTNMVQAVIDKKDAAEASLIYNNQDKAFELLKEAESLIGKLPDGNKSERDKKEELTADIENVMMVLRKLEIVQSEIVADLGGQFPDARVSGLERIDDMLIAYGPDDQNIYMIDIATGNINTSKHVDAIHLTRADTPKEQDSVVFLDGTGGVAAFKKTSQTIGKEEIGFPADKVDIADAVVYNLRLYNVDRENNQIYKHGKTSLGYDKGTAWLKEQYDLSDATAIAIDGDIFVTKANGEIYKFVNGELSDFAVAGVDPVLENPTDIYTYNDINNIYIFEPTHKRVIILDKNGKLIQQYTSNEWQSPSGMVVDEHNGRIYILDKTKIYSFAVN